MRAPADPRSCSSRTRARSPSRSRARSSAKASRRSIAPTAREALELFRRHDPSLVLLDLALPDGDGREVCRELRRESAVPIIMLTARGTETDRIVGLELGADDYVVKPFSAAEVIARIRAVLRRSGRDATAALQPPSRSATCGWIPARAARCSTARSSTCRARSSTCSCG